MNTIPTGTVVRLLDSRLYSHAKVIDHGGTNYMGVPILIVAPFNPGEREAQKPAPAYVPQNKVQA